MSPYVYLAGPYTGLHHDHRSYFEIDRNIMRSLEAAAELAKEGIGFFCPHAHSSHFEIITPDVPPSFWYGLDMHFLAVCDGILMLPHWENSKGSQLEKAWAEEHNMPVFYSVEEVVEWAKSVVS